MEIFEERLAELMHHLKTPLNAISGFSQLLAADDCTDEDRLVYNQMVTQATEQLAGSVNDVISYCLHGAERGIEEMLFDVSKTIGELFFFYEPLAAEKGLSLICKPVSHEFNYLVFSDEKKFIQILENLLSNALKYTETGTIEIGCKADSNKQLTVYVQDTGIGIKADEFGKIFDLFYRSPDAATRNIEGTGMGLSIVYRLAAMLGTEIQFESEYGKGSCFWLTL